MSNYFLNTYRLLCYLAVCLSFSVSTLSAQSNQGLPSEGKLQSENLLYQNRIPLNDEQKIVIRNNSGSLWVSSQDSTDEMVIKVWQEKSFSIIDRAQQLSGEVEVWIKKDIVQIETLHNNRRSGSKEGPIYRIELLIPNGRQILVENRNGDVSFQKLSVDFAISCAYGSIYMQQVTGLPNSRMKTYKGDININAFSGFLMALSKRGNINLNAIQAEIRAKALNGDITGAKLSGTLLCRTEQGNITLESQNPGKLINLSSTNGNISLMAPGNLGMDIKIQGSPARLINDTGSFTGKQTEQLIEGTIGDKKLPVVLSATNGESMLILNNPK